MKIIPLSLKYFSYFSRLIAVRVLLYFSLVPSRRQLVIKCDVTQRAQREAIALGLKPSYVLDSA